MVDPGDVAAVDVIDHQLDARVRGAAGAPPTLRHMPRRARRAKGAFLSLTAGTARPLRPVPTLRLAGKEIVLHRLLCLPVNGWLAPKPR